MRNSKTALLLATLAAAFITLPARAGVNFLTNSSFEVQGSGCDETAFRWNFNNPDIHGEVVIGEGERDERGDEEGPPAHGAESTSGASSGAR